MPAPGSVLPPVGAPPPAQPPAGQPTPSDPHAAARQRCIDVTNQYRAQVGVTPLTPAPASQQSCASAQAARDAQLGQPHGSFGQCNENAQNECPSFSGTPEAAVEACLKLMFDEGPGEGPAHGHYNNMTRPSYGQVACGFSVTADGKVWIVQNFFR
jgi:uncharacterized protein YkwD